MTRISLVALLVGAAACDRSLQLNLVINDPCNVDVLSTSGLAYMEVMVEAPQLDAPVRATFTADEARGQLNDLKPVSEAVISVHGRAANGSGGPGDIVLATGVGLVDLSGADQEDAAELSVVLGRVGTFVRTTDTEDYAARRCTQQVARRRGHTATVLGNGVVFVAGGANQTQQSSLLWTTTEFYDPRIGLFTQGPEMTWERLGHTATALKDGRVLLAGGLTVLNGAPDTLGVAQTYDPAQGFGPAATMTARAYHSATLLQDGRVLLAGGVDNELELNSTDIYDPVTNRTTPGPTLSSARLYHAAVLLPGNVVALIGGRDEDSALATIEFVDVTNNRAQLGPSLAQARTYPMVGYLPERSVLLVAGGFSALGAPESGVGLDTAEVVQLTTNVAQSNVACSDITLSTKRGDGGIAAVPNGFVLIGGVANGQALNSAEYVLFEAADICDPRVSVTQGDMAVARGAPVLTPLIGGDILVSGGYDTVDGQPVSLGEGEVFVSPRFNR